ncbi:MAG: hypothetical protein R3Y36_06270 [Spirochaetales bacterium]
MIISKEIKQKKSAKKHEKSPLILLSNRLILFLTLFSCITFMYYMGGNHQDFSDQNQILLLNTASIVSVILLWFICVACIVLIIYAFKKKTFYFFRFLPLYIISAVLGLIILFFVTIVMFFAR